MSTNVKYRQILRTWLAMERTCADRLVQLIFLMRDVFNVLVVATLEHTVRT